MPAPLQLLQAPSWPHLPQARRVSTTMSSLARAASDDITQRGERGFHRYTPTAATSVDANAYVHDLQPDGNVSSKQTGNTVEVKLHNVAVVRKGLLSLSWPVSNNGTTESPARSIKSLGENSGGYRRPGTGSGSMIRTPPQPDLRRFSLLMFARPGDKIVHRRGQKVGDLDVEAVRIRGDQLMVIFGDSLRDVFRAGTVLPVAPVARRPATSRGIRRLLLRSHEHRPFSA
jgi:hypothetical protein